MSEVALLNPPSTSEMMRTLRNNSNATVGKLEAVILQCRCATFDEYAEAFGALNAARAMRDDVETIIRSYERK